MILRFGSKYAGAFFCIRLPVHRTEAEERKGPLVQKKRKGGMSGFPAEMDRDARGM